MCREAVRREPCSLAFVLDYFKNQEMCEKAFKKYLWLLKYVPDGFVTHQQLKTWHDNNDYCNDDDELIEWYDGYKKRKAQKARIKKELMLIVCHLSRYWDWCMSEDEKTRQKNCGHKHGLFVSDGRIQKIFLSIKFSKNLSNILVKR